MCGIAGIISRNGYERSALSKHLKIMNKLQIHRGPDGNDIWCHKNGNVGLAHVRLSIVDLINGSQPMKDVGGNYLVFNGEIYNYIELRAELGVHNFFTTSDTEVILEAYRKWGRDCINHFRGMFAFALWDEQKKELFCARDRFGIKPFYYYVKDDVVYFASEIKTLLPFVDKIDVNKEACIDYLNFQFSLNGKTMFKDIHELKPAHSMVISKQGVDFYKYWDVYYNLDFEHTEKYFEEKLRNLLEESINLHIRSDVPIGAYISGGIDSSSLAVFASRKNSESRLEGFIGTFRGYDGKYDETSYARELVKENNIHLHEVEITSHDFIENIRKVIYHLDSPVAGPGSFPQFIVSKYAAKHRKVVLGGQGGDEIFGGYTRYLIAYFEQCIKGAIEGTLNNGNFVVTYESIIPNLVALKNYKPLMKEFFSSGLFESLDNRYYKMINRAPQLGNEINWEILKSEYQPFESFKKIFNGSNVNKEAYFDKMTHFDFKTLLPALLQVEDRMSMASGLESRVPLLDHRIVELAATIPADIKFKDGTLKRLYLNIVKDILPEKIVSRTDKMGFPVPLGEWLKSDIKDFVQEIFTYQKEKNRAFFNSDNIIAAIENEGTFSRKIWGLLSIELWYQEFVDRETYFKKLIEDETE